MIENIVLKSFLTNRVTFEKYGPYVLALKNQERNVNLMLGHIKVFYESYPNSNEIVESEFRLYLKGNDTFNFASNNDQFIRSIFQTPITNKDLTMDVIESMCERYFAATIIDKAALVLNQNQTRVISSIQDVIDEYHGLIRKPPQEYTEYTLNIDELLKEEITSKGVPFVNDTPNNIIRGMRPGQLGLIYAYVDTGKTSYGISNLCSVANYLHRNNDTRNIVYAVNEESVKRVTVRAIQCITNWGNDELAQHQKLIAPILKQRGFDNIVFLDHVNTIVNVEKILLKYKPIVMFIDQGTKVQVPHSKREGVGALEEVFNRYRDLAKRYDCTIVSMAQGGDDCFQKKYPTLRDIYGSKSAIQGELDWAISIGTDVCDARYQGFRYFNISKNKGDKATYACRFDHHRCQFKEVM